MSCKKATGRRRVHFIGIGGIGMSALARYFLALSRVEGKAHPSTSSGPIGKWAVSGSDMVESPLTKKLIKEGVNVKIGHKKGYITPDIGLIVYSQAITPDNPELQEARRLGIPCRSYPEVVGELTQKYETIAVAGSHGKSTTTALVALILKKAGLDPTVIIGVELKEFLSPVIASRPDSFGSGRRGNPALPRLPRFARDDSRGVNFRMGHGPYLVLEADEFGRAFHHYSPTLAIVTNVDREHLDIYQGLAGVQEGFLEFVEKIKSGGVAVLNRDSNPLFALKAKISAIAKKRNVRVVWYSLRDPAAKKIAKVIKIPGAHNVSNALAAYRLAAALKIPESKILSAIGAYRGSSRRFEYRGNLKIENCKLSAGGGSTLGGKIKVYDDYAHHPTEIRATLQAFREKYPDSKIICVFQPHQAKRLEALFKEFQTAFDGADTTLILPIYKVTGRDSSLSSPLASLKLRRSGRKRGSGLRFTSESLVRAIQKLRPARHVFYLKDPRNLKYALDALLFYPRASASHLRSSAVIVMMGAGDIVNYTDSLLKK